MKNKHPIEAEKSYELYAERHDENHRRELKKHHEHHTRDIDTTGDEYEEQKEQEYWEEQAELEKEKAKKHKQKAKSFSKKVEELLDDPGISQTKMHGMMIDAGSKGSRIHLYEWKPRILEQANDIDAAVSGRKLSYPDPGTETRWTDRIKPGIDSFAKFPDDELVPAIAKYLAQFLDFAKTILKDQETDWANFPIYWRATAGMRIVDTDDRARIVGAVRELFSNNTFCPFQFSKEQARVISGEEEAIFDWVNVNFLLNVLVPESQGAGTVIDPKLTYGALDMGGASTQISFYEPNEDIMSNLFKLQIGSGKHWNLYAHSFLHYGIVEAQRRFEARLADGHTSTQRLIDGIYNPCLPGGSSKEIRTNIHFNSTTELETWHYTEDYASGNGFYPALLQNNNATGDFSECMKHTYELLNLHSNSWCEFSHNGECSFAGVYQPNLPTQVEGVGGFIAFSNYRHVWDFLQLPDEASLSQIRDATEKVCSMSKEEYMKFYDGSVDSDEVEDYCFRSAYVFNLLKFGYGFKIDDNITSVETINSQKAGWALGAMLYEINTMPWTYASHEHEIPVFEHQAVAEDRMLVLFVVLSLIGFGMSAVLGYKLRQVGKRSKYEAIPESKVEL